MVLEPVDDVPVAADVVGEEDAWAVLVLGKFR